MSQQTAVKTGGQASSDICLVGHPFAPIGMGEHVRSAWRAFRAAVISPLIRDIYGLEKRTDPDYEREFAPQLTQGLSRRLNIFHINGDEVEQALAHLNDPAFDAAYNVIYPAWELSKYPEPWMRQLERFDEIWAPSAFIHDAITDGTKTPVIHMPLAVEIKFSGFLSRRRFGIPDNAFCILFFFDFGSYSSRKNPEAVLRVVEALIERDPDMPLHCILKVKGGGEGTPEFRALAKRIDGLGGRAVLLAETLSDNEIKNLVRCSDCFVSLHRSEGFGRGMAEAMRLGRLTVATGYSGNMDFMTPETSLLVRHVLAPLGEGAYPHWRGQVWAEPDMDHAVELIESVLADREAMQIMTDRARNHMRTWFSARAVGNRYGERVNEILATGAKVALWRGGN